MTELRSQPKGPAPPADRDTDPALREIDALSRQIESLQQEVAWSNRLTTLGTMAAVLAHEYNNLLTPVGSYAQLALDNPLDAELTEKALLAAVRGIAQARAIAEATLGFARPEEADQDHVVAIGQAMDQALACIEQALTRDTIELVTDLPDVEVSIASVQLQQVLINLMDNARKAMAHQPTTRRLTIAGKLADGGVEVRVTDTGPGIPDELAGRLFEAFATQPTDTDSSAGTGLGLRICRDLITAAGGWIRAEQVADRGQSCETARGACFTFWLPCASE